MDRNKNFYNQYHVNDYFIDIHTHKNINFINHINDIEISLLKPEFKKNIKYALVIGMGYGKEIDWLNKIYLNIKLDVIDFSENFINFGKHTYKNINFIQMDIKKIDENFKFSNYDLIISFNTIDYLKPNEGYRLINFITKSLKKNALFIFRLQNKFSFMAFIRQLVMNKRKKDLPVTFTYDCKYIKNKGLDLCTQVEIKKGPILLEGFDFLYSSLWNLFSYFEKMIRFLVPEKFCNSIYFKFTK